MVQEKDSCGQAKAGSVKPEAAQQGCPEESQVGRGGTTLLFPNKGLSPCPLTIWACKGV